MEKIQPYRQPMVTASGIFLGFMLGFTSEWIRYTTSIHRLRDVFVAFSIVTSLSMLMITLFRILRMHYPQDPDRYYRKTLILFLIGVFIPFVAFTFIIVEKFFVGLR